MNEIEDATDPWRERLRQSEEELDLVTESFRQCGERLVDVRNERQRFREALEHIARIEGRKAGRIARAALSSEDATRPTGDGQ